MEDLEEVIEESKGMGLKGKIGIAVIATTMALSSMTIKNDNPVPEVKPVREIYDKNGDVLLKLDDEGQTDYSGALSGGDVSELLSEYNPENSCSADDLFTWYAETGGDLYLEMPKKEIIAMAEQPTPEYVEENFLNSQTPVTIPENPYTAEEKELFAKLICAEARGDTYEGMLAVGRVVVLRMSNYGQNLKEVIFAPGQFPPARNLGYITPSEECIKAAQDVINGADPFNGEVAYHFDNINRCPGNEILVADNIFCP